MKILILSNNRAGYATKRLIVELQKRKDTYEVIDPSDLYAYISSTTSGHDRIYKKTEEKSERILSKNYDAVIPRIGGKGFDHSVMILKQLNSNMNIFSTANEQGMKICSNKFLSAQVLSRHKIRNPKQVLAYQPNDFKELIDLAGGLPCIAKLQRGSLGVGIMILTDELAASTSLRSFQSLGVSVILQKFIDSGSPANDIRVFVVGAETKKPKLFSYKRYALDTDFRSNYSISGLGEKVTITKEEKQMSIDAALAVGLGVCGVDIMRDSKNEDKPYVIEINSTPGLKGVEKVTGENVAGAIIDYVKGNYKQGGRSGTTAENYDQQPGLSNLTFLSKPFTANESVYLANKYYEEIKLMHVGKSVDAFIKSKPLIKNPYSSIIRFHQKKNKKQLFTPGSGTVIKLGHMKLKK